MRGLRFILLMLATAGMLLAGLLAPALGRAANHCPHHFGAAQQLPDAGGGTQEWTVASLKKSGAVLPGYQPAGQLWEAEVTVRAAEGTVTPLIPNLAGHAKGEYYPALWQVATDQGLSAATLTEGQTSSGTVYFDATGSDPTAVVYGGGDGAVPAMMWCCESMSMPMDPRMNASMKEMMEGMSMKGCPCYGSVSGPV